MRMRTRLQSRTTLGNVDNSWVHEAERHRAKDREGGGAKNGEEDGAAAWRGEGVRGGRGSAAATANATATASASATASDNANANANAKQFGS
jgi:hypothetical protein